MNINRLPLLKAIMFITFCVIANITSFAKRLFAGMGFTDIYSFEVG